MKDASTYGLMAEFDNVNDVITAARRVYGAGYRKIDAYSPFPLEELSEAIGFHKNGVALVCLIGGLAGRHGGFHVAVVDQQRRLSGKHWRTAAEFVAVVHHCDF